MVYTEMRMDLRAEDGRITHLSKEYIRAILKGAMVGHIRISLPEYAELRCDLRSMARTTTEKNIEYRGLAMGV
ncbi:hypothetical protein Bca52824_065050 [Brassica carinata]|uniref:Uncharacterized protein n=1 Tax=Brassica carinata TaxID=52824 RepID=A0A8X7U8T7_BRACI|nr:hypothetical protein Bca52824_065050 [Brassica carinata]